ncbi:MAG: retroviral-like aspartic protease family protein [SAR324 cluster bacterium]|nr:retroviral-like aspartic protease family protein [SAR324 cluster bacterium]
MGKVIVQNVVLKNNIDYHDVVRGHISEAALRSQTVSMIADTGARVVSLPKSIVEALGLPKSREVGVMLANGQKEIRSLYGELRLQIGDRESVFDCIANSDEAPLLLGQIVLESLDFVVDCPHQRLVPNPEAPPGMMLYDEF